MKDALARLEALERGQPGDLLLIVTERQTPDGRAMSCQAAICCPCPMFTHT